MQLSLVTMMGVKVKDAGTVGDRVHLGVLKAQGPPLQEADRGHRQGGIIVLSLL